MKFESHKASTMLTLWKCPYCGQTFAVGDDKELLEDGSTRKMPLIYSIEPIYCPLCGKALNERSTNMAVNTNKELWESIARHFGVELEEEFRIKRNSRLTEVRYKFGDEGLEYFKNDISGWCSAPMSESILLHDDTISIFKLPWKPKEGEKYYTYGESLCYGEDIIVISPVWQGNILDLTHFALNLCYRTRKEAEEHLNENINKLREGYKNG